jgi:hypothetical protein
MEKDPLWTRCLHLSAGTCPELGNLGQQLGGASDRRPELNQDLALTRLGQACLICQLKPNDPEQT